MSIHSAATFIARKAASTTASGSPAKAVSYTHLDVYKRQILNRAKKHFLMRQRVNAVSYTHLDVYKRQY